MAKELLEPPEAWARPFLEHVSQRLLRTGHQGAGVWPYRWPFAAIAAGHLTGLDYFYEYAIEAYYELVDAAEEARPLAEPRWSRLLPYLDEDVEALAAFEERLADSATVLCAEPVLAAALLGLAAGTEPGQGWRLAGYTGRAGAYPILARRRGKRCRILVPSPVYTLAVSGLSVAGLRGPGEARIVVPDPAAVRKTVYDARVAYGELSEWLRGLVGSFAEKAARASASGRPCEVEGVLYIRYSMASPLEAEFEYLC